jgi:hypothetical protein
MTPVWYVKVITVSSSEEFDGRAYVYSWMHSPERDFITAIEVLVDGKRLIFDENGQEPSGKYRLSNHDLKKVLDSTIPCAP